MEHDEAKDGSDPVTFGTVMRASCFNFSHDYKPLNHGSFGTFPTTVQKYQQQLQLESETEPDTFIRYTYLRLLKEARTAVAPLLGVQTDEVVFIPNATTGVNTVLRNLQYKTGDVILHFNTIYGACLKTIQSLQERTPLESKAIELTYPLEDDDILSSFRTAVEQLRQQNKNAKLAMFDTVLTFPGVKFPWEKLVEACKELGILSLIDGAHGIGHIDLTGLGRIGPDFFISNCYKWLMTPRGSAVLHVPYRNHRLIHTTFPTSWGYEPPSKREKMPATEYFVRLFDKVSTTDNIPYICVVKSLQFREQECGGEAKIREYCMKIALDGGNLMAKRLGTKVLENKTGTLRKCCFTNVRLPLEVASASGEKDSVPVEEAQQVAKWMQEATVIDYKTYIPTKYYAGAFWVRISGQIYLTLEDFDWAATVMLELCQRVKAGEGRTAME